MKLHSIPIDEIEIPANRQRQAFNDQAIAELAGSIGENGLLCPVIVRKGQDNLFILVAGERRLKALSYLWILGEPLRCGEQHFPENVVPCLYLGDLTPLEAEEAELEENIRRVDLTWSERALATARLAKLRVQQAARDGKPIPEIKQIAAETRPDEVEEGAAQAVRKELIVAKYLHDPDVAAAKTLDDGYKVVKRKEETARNEALGIEIGKSFRASHHTLIHGNCLEAMADLAPGTFDIILSDPPYGIGAQDFNDSGGIGGALGGHFYNDDPVEWRRLMEIALIEMFRLAKPMAHLYLFCDIDRFIELKVFASIAGWSPFRTPLIWHKPSGMRAPWPTSGPQRKYELILYAKKGDKLVTKLMPDVIACTPDANLGHPAQKPVALYRDLLRRSAQPGDSVLDPFCGSGTIFPACHGLVLNATGIEQDPAAYGLAARRLGELK